MSTEVTLPPHPGGKSKSSVATFKILIIGDSSVGKTSLLNRYCDDSFQGALIATVGEDSSPASLEIDFTIPLGSPVGIDYKTKHVSLDDETVKLQIWFV